MMKGHWQPLFAQLVILVTMIAIGLIDQRVYVTLIAMSLPILPIATWTIAFILLWTSAQAPDVESLSEAVDDAFTLAINSTVAAILGLVVLGRQAGVITSSMGPFITVGIGFIVVTISLPALRKLRVWRNVWLPIVRNRNP